MAEERKPRSGTTRRSTSKPTTARAKKPASTAKAKAPAKRTTAAKAKAPAKKAATSRTTAKAPAKRATTARAKAPAKRAAAAKPKAQAAPRARTRPPVNQPAPEGGNGKPAIERIEGDLPTAPSLGPNTVIERRPARERLAEHEQSGVDAMGKDKRRNVVGVSYGPSRARQATLYGAFLAIVIALGIGGKLLIDKADEPPDTIKAEAPWAQDDAVQVPPKPIQ